MLRLLLKCGYSRALRSINPSPWFHYQEIIKIQYNSKGNYKVDTVYLENGEEMSGSTVAAPFNNLLLVGNVFDKHFLILESSN